jgi:hypothetical protein
MARVTFSPLVADVRGKTGGIVFSNWKGRAVVRTRVTPANPDTASQQRIRNHMALIVSWWHFLPESMQDDCTLLAAGESISGFNAFTKRNVRDLEMSPNPFMPRIMPLNAILTPATELVGVAGSATKSVDLTWTPPPDTAPNRAILLASKLVEGEHDMELLSILGWDDLIDFEDGAATVVMPEAETPYEFYLMQAQNVPRRFSYACTCQATSKV